MIVYQIMYDYCSVSYSSETDETQQCKPARRRGVCAEVRVVSSIIMCYQCGWGWRLTSVAFTRRGKRSMPETNVLSEARLTSLIACHV